MEAGLSTAALHGLQNLLSLQLFLIILLGVGLGTIIAVTPQGFGTPLAYALLLPIVVKWEPLNGIALLIGLSAVSAICAAYLPVLFGIPGGAGSQATVLDGYPMGRKGEARQALGASFMAGGMGALIGTVTLAVSIPIAAPLVRLLGAPELAVIVFWGLTMIAVLAGREPLKGVIAAAFGLVLSTVGQQGASGIMRFTFDQIYLWNGFELSIIAVALFGIPSAFNLAVNKIGVEKESAPLTGSLFDGIKIAVREWWLVIRCSFMGVWVGLIPGVGAQTVDWLAYGHAAQTCKGARETFGRGDVRGVIAPESANDAKDGGDLMSVLLLGIPQGTTTALFIVALLAWGLVPGPEMIRKHTDVIFSIIWIQGVSGIIGTLLGFVLANQLAKLAQVRYSLLVPLILTFVFLGALSVNGDPLDLATVIGFGILGYFMWRLGYPRPAMILGFVLGTLLERYLFRSIMSYGFRWLQWPSVIILLIFALVTLALTFWSRRETQSKTLSALSASAQTRPLSMKFQGRSLFTLFFLIVFAVVISFGWKWPLVASLLPVYVVGIPGGFLCVVQLSREVITREPMETQSLAFEADESFNTYLDRWTEIRRTLNFFSWFIGGATSIWLFGIVISLPLFVLLYTLGEGRERWPSSLLMSAGVLLLIWGLFEYFLGIRWPRGALFQ